MNNLPDEGEEIAFVELNADGSPYQVFTAVYRKGRRVGFGSMYDIERSKASGEFLMSDSGGGDAGHLQRPDAKWWARADHPVADVDVYDGHGAVTGRPPDEKNRVGDDHLLSFQGMQGDPFPIKDLADRVRVVDSLVVCGTCDDWLDGDDTNNPCEHTRWCDKCGWWSTPEEPCRHDKKGGRP